MLKEIKGYTIVMAKASNGRNHFWKDSIFKGTTKLINMKTMRNLIFFALMLTLITNCNNTKETIEPEFKLSTTDNLDVNEYQIYSLILTEVYTTSNDLVVMQKTSRSIPVPTDNIYYESLKTEIKNLDTTIFADLVENNDSTFNLDNKFDITSKSITLISSAELQYLLNSQDINKGWEQFYKKYPNSNGIIDFSRVGFNNDKNQAILETGHYYASLGADGLLIYLTKNENAWRIIKIINT